MINIGSRVIAVEIDRQIFKRTRVVGTFVIQNLEGSI